MVQIRPAADTDAPAIADLIASLAHLFLASPDGAGSVPFLDSITPPALAAFMVRADVVYLVGERNGELCGAVGVVCDRRKPPHLHHLFVAPQFQGRGIGGQLWLAARRATWTGKATGAFTVNASLSAVAVYRRFGFETVGKVAQANGLIFQPMQQLAHPSGTADPAG